MLDTATADASITKARNLGPAGTLVALVGRRNSNALNMQRRYASVAILRRAQKYSPAAGDRSRGEAVHCGSEVSMADHGSRLPICRQCRAAREVHPFAFLTAAVFGEMAFGWFGARQQTAQIVN